MEQNFDNILQEKLKIGYLVIVQSKREAVTDCYGLDIIAPIYRFIGTVVGIEQNNKFIDLIARRMFYLIPRDNINQPILDNIDLNSTLYVTFVAPLEHSELNITVIKGSLVTANFLKNITKNLRTQNRGHIFDPENLFYFQSKYEQDYIEFMETIFSVEDYELVETKKPKDNIIQLHKKLRHRHVK